MSEGRERLAALLRRVSYEKHRARMRAVREHAGSCSIFAWEDGVHPYLCRCDCGAEVPR